MDLSETEITSTMDNEEEQIRAPDEQISECLIPQQNYSFEKKKRRRRKRSRSEREHEIEYNIPEEEDTEMSCNYEQELNRAIHQSLQDEKKNNYEKDLEKVLQSSLEEFDEIVQKEVERVSSQERKFELEKKYGAMISFLRMYAPSSREFEFYSMMKAFFNSENHSTTTISKEWEEWLLSKSRFEKIYNNLKKDGFFDSE